MQKTYSNIYGEIIHEKSYCCGLADWSDNWVYSWCMDWLARQNMSSKIRVKCMEEIRKKPGILRTELYSMNIGHRCSIGLQVSRLVYYELVVRIWDDIMRSWRLYPKGTEPQPFIYKTVYKKCIYSKDSRNPIPNAARGGEFYMAFDEAFGLLYIDLKILGTAIGGKCRL